MFRPTSLYQHAFLFLFLRNHKGCISTIRSRSTSRQDLLDDDELLDLESEEDMFLEDIAPDQKRHVVVAKGDAIAELKKTDCVDMEMDENLRFLKFETSNCRRVAKEVWN